VPISSPGREEAAPDKLNYKPTNQNIVFQEQFVQSLPEPEYHVSLPNQNFEARPNENEHDAIAHETKPTSSLPPINMPTPIQHFDHDLESLKSIKSEANA
jgi:hypothetical protein